MSRRGKSQIPVIAFLARHGHDFAAKFEGRARSGWRHGGRPEPFRALGPTATSFHEVRSHAQLELLRLSARGIEQVNVAALLVSNFPSAGRRVYDREIGVFRQAPNGLLFLVEGIDAELPVAVGP